MNIMHTIAAISLRDLRSSASYPLSRTPADHLRCNTSRRTRYRAYPAIQISRIQLYDRHPAKRNVTNERIRIISNYIGISNRPGINPVVNTFEYFETLNTHRTLMTDQCTSVIYL